MHVCVRVCVCFPYALQALPETLKSKWDSPQFAQYRDAFPAEYRSSQAAFEEHVKDLVSRDVKASYLKSLQGYLWEKGYKSGELKAPLFEDVPPKFASWRKDRLRVMIYSSGSVPAQKLLFRHTNAKPSDLTPQITDFFDTVNAGPKTEAASYEKIAGKYKRYAPNEWLFLSDNVKEVEAAIAAGMQSYVVERPGNPDLPKDIQKRHKVIRNFDELDNIGS
ncbi:putative enolase-phosphatase e1 protein [Phaeoacremonium minimum UCRPA7]|uniref:Putative enolase-phosphatase e1 protein n=1 Tax=Phaeoacremonium minimum (strain UCR-PA7) TaxID=1286976 RepID=R8BUA7_PHAM7|nr:putative enolase-phosphatase e1 protein [Phaeoacremonium minimum UCRPA7]EOO02860.1 putative enolase-phosphatase e1 protein [Phaeoacremonium minimum UCRPA7]